MTAYVIVDVTVNNPEEYAEYRALSGPSVEQYGGTFIARGGAVTALEGDWTPQRLVIIEFPSVDAARRWWDSPEYTVAKQIRYRTADSRMIVVEGV
jgi:uncharacterized protein (DUF1330 family)